MPDFYERNSEAFIASTRDADMSEARSRFISALPKVVDPARLLDAGSGSGRDALAFRQLGFQVEAFDASSAMVAATRKHAGVDARKLLFEEFAWEHAFEGIWACASLLHVAIGELPQVIDRLGKHLVSGGAFYASFKLGKGEREKDGRRFTDMTIETVAELLDGPGYFGQPDIWVSHDSRPERASEMWVNAVVNKT